MIAVCVAERSASLVVFNLLMISCRKLNSVILLSNYQHLALDKGQLASVGSESRSVSVWSATGWSGLVSLGHSTVYCFIVVQSWPGWLFIAHVWESEYKGGA